ncbi:MAG: YafY family transcriptional regulator [Actinomycetia bacterium]|nr:YafY family transcriptional regulator [Actinomycetes bacterium]
MDTATRLLRLLGLLSSRSGWTGTELAERIEVTERTLRRDITRLRELGYPIEATTGPYGGYELGSGGRLPPLVLDDDEAVAVAMALRAVAGFGATGSESGALSALTKLEQVLPAGLRERVGALATFTVGLRRGNLPPVDVDTLVIVALACRRSECVRFDYRDANDADTNRLVHPYRVVYTERQWYLVAFDTSRDDWRTFRVDRMSVVGTTGTRFTPNPDPPDAAGLVARGIAVASYTTRATVRLHLGIDQARRCISSTIAVLEDAGDGTTIAQIGGDPDWIARYLAGLECTFALIEPDEVRKELHALAARLLET